ncbi:MAG: ABC transporter ATP-binding protein [Dehalococcoidia bacterium]
MSHYLWRMRPYFRQVAGQLAIGAVAGIVMNTAIVLPAILLGRAIDIVRAFGRGQASSATLAWIVLALIGGTVLTEGPRIVKRYWLGTARARIRANVRADGVRGVLSWPMAQLHQTPVGDLMARIVGDVEVLGTGVGEFVVETWDTLLFSLSLVVAMLAYDAQLTVLTLLPVPIAMLLAHASGRWVSQRTATSRAVNAEMTALLQEQLAGIRVTRLFGRRSATVARFATLSKRQAEANLATTRVQTGLRPVYSSLMTAGVLLLVWKGSERVIAGGMTVGALVAYLQLYVRFIGRAPRIPQMVNTIQAGGAAYDRLAPLLAPPLSARVEPPWASFRWGHVAGIAMPPVALPDVVTGPAALSLEHVTFRYPGTSQDVLTDVSLTVVPGALVAVTGPVGAGKSALARVLLGLYPVKQGTVLLDNRPLQELPAAERARRIGYLPQEPHLFSGSVRENVLLQPPGVTTAPVPMLEAPMTLDHAVTLAALQQDLRDLPAGLETEIGELGVRISGGQRQRIALARALAASSPATPGLLVLDDPFSAVDVDTEADIVAALREAFGPLAPPERRATIVLCSHRLAAFPKADQVVVLDGGRIVEQGTHSALLEADGLYARIYRAQRRASSDGALAEVHG